MKNTRRKNRSRILDFKKLNKIVQEEVLREFMLNEEVEDEKMSNSELTKTLKANASDIAATIPSVLNDDLNRIITTLTAMAKFDKQKFTTVVKYADKLGATALEKAQSEEAAADKE